ncbi:unnamed protein product [Ceratitis capitata]|uniref:(Mediterranean fruit fly) hypothetical protein n=1 Tax=Ceratitis capitata TaxID=7213 RepID=A0A811UID5_CERCA|nr:unnamed protein product [Ceratitis capitata]
MNAVERVSPNQNRERKIFNLNCKSTMCQATKALHSFVVHIVKMSVQTTNKQQEMPTDLAEAQLTLRPMDHLASFSLCWYWWQCAYVAGNAVNIDKFTVAGQNVAANGI